jgi:hypothetical protein
MISAAKRARSSKIQSRRSYASCGFFFWVLHRLHLVNGHGHGTENAPTTTQAAGSELSPLSVASFGRIKRLGHC